MENNRRIFSNTRSRFGYTSSSCRHNRGSERLFTVCAGTPKSEEKEEREIIYLMGDMESSMSPIRPNLLGGFFYTEPSGNSVISDLILPHSHKSSIFYGSPLSHRILLRRSVRLTNILRGIYFNRNIRVTFRVIRVSIAPLG